MKTLRILAWILFFSISGVSHAVITIPATGAAVERFIDASDDFGGSGNAHDDERIGESHQFMVGRVLSGLTAQDSLAIGTGAGMAIDRSLRLLSSDNTLYRIAQDGDTILRRKYAVILGILPDGSSTLTSEINTRGPEPDMWAIVVLGIGFVIYQIRPRNTLRAANLV